MNSKGRSVASKNAGTSSNSSPSASKLAAQSSQSSEQLPLLNIKSRSQEIFIPSVADYADFSPRSLDSRSLVSVGSIASPVADARRLSNLIARTRAHSQQQYGRNAAVKAGINGKEITISLEPEKDLPLTRLDILEAYLPKHLRQEAKRHRKLRVAGEAKNDVVFNILSGKAGYNPMGYSRLLPSAATTGIATHSIDSAQTMTVQSYQAAHDPSGAISAPNSTLLTPSNHHPPQQQQQSGELAPLRTYSRSNRGQRKTLWASDIQQSLIEREEAIKRQLREAEEQRSLEISKQLELRRLQEEHEIKLKVKVINTLFNKKVKFRDAKMAAIAEEMLRLKEEGFDLTHAAIQKLNDEATRMLKKDVLTFSHDIDDDNNVATATATAVDIAGRRRHSLRDSFESSGTSASSVADGSIGGDDDSFIAAPTAADNSSAAAAGKQERVRKSPTRSRLKKKLKQRRRRSSDEDVLVFRSKDFKSDNGVDSGGSGSEAESVSNDLLASIEDIAISNLRKKLYDLKKYVSLHTTRKLMDSWNFIEGRIKNSSHMKAFVVPGIMGLSHPVQHTAVALSTLTQMLSSARVKIGSEELHQLYSELGFISTEQAYFSRKVAALHVVLQQVEENSPQFHEYRQMLLELTLDAEEPLVTLNELKDITFDKDPAERNKQVEQIVANRQKELDALLEEKQRKDSMKEQAEKRRQRLIIDFEGSLEQLNILDGDGKLTAEKLEEFLQMLLRCRKFVAKMLDDKAANIPEELVSYLGLEVFPKSIQDKITERKRIAWEKYKRSKAAAGDSDAAAASGMSDESGSNPFLDQLQQQQQQQQLQSDGSVGSGTITTAASHFLDACESQSLELNEHHPFAAPNLPTVLEAVRSPLHSPPLLSLSNTPRTPRTPLLLTPRTARGTAIAATAAATTTAASVEESKTAITFPSSTDWGSSAASLEASLQGTAATRDSDYQSDDNSSMSSIPREHGNAFSLANALADFAATKARKNEQSNGKKVKKQQQQQQHAEDTDTDDASIGTLDSPQGSVHQSHAVNTDTANATAAAAVSATALELQDGAESVGSKSRQPRLSPRRHKMSSIASLARTATSASHSARRQRTRRAISNGTGTATSASGGMSVNSSRSRNTRRFIWTLKRVLLTGPPKIVDLLRETASYGRGLQGMSYRDAISVLQFVSATKISSIFRCFIRRWRYFAARKKWRRIFGAIKSAHLSAWRVLTKHNSDTRQNCWRKLIGWRNFTRRAHRLREQFRVCYWPFYVWRRYANESGRAKEKARFLVGRVLPTYTLLHVFRGWKKYSKAEGRLNLIGIRYRKRIIKQRFKLMFQWLHCWARKRRRIRRSWNRSGQYKLKLYMRNLIRVPFLIWCSYIELRRTVRGRLRTEFHALRKVLPIAQSPHQKLSNSEKRLKLKNDEKKRRAIRIKKVSKVQLKDRVKQRNRAKMNADTQKKNRSGGAKSRSPPPRSGARGSVAAAAAVDNSSDDEEKSKTTLLGPFPDFTDVVAKYFPNESLTWQLRQYKFSGYDVSSDDDDDNDINNTDDNDSNSNDSSDSNGGSSIEKGDAYLPAVLCDCFDRANIAEFPAAADLDNINESYDKNVMRRVTIVRDRFRDTDKWNIFEAAMRFQRFARRALHNLRDFAVKRRKWRLFLKRRHFRIRCSVWSELRLNADQGARKAQLQRASEAEVLASTMRQQQVQKMVRQRKATMDVNAAYGRDFGDDFDADERADQRMRTLNLIDDDDNGIGNSGDDFLQQEQRRVAQRLLELKQQQAVIDKTYKPPDLLLWDRNDRELEEKVALKMVGYAKRTAATALEDTKFADVDSAEYRSKAAVLEQMVVEVVATESKVTDRALEKQKQYVAAFKVHAADRLLTVLANIWQQAQQQMLQQEAKIYFRALRLPMLHSRSKSMFRRKRLQNWLRICARLNAISRRAHHYNRIRSKWVFYNRWLKFLALEKLNPTPGMQSFARRKALLHPDFDIALANGGFVKSVYHDNQRLRDCISDFAVIFSRWKVYTQELVVFRVMQQKAAALNRLKTLQRCFLAIKTELHAEEIALLISQQQSPFAIQRVEADLQQLSKKFLAHRRKSTANVIRKYNKKFSHKMKKLNKQAISFKKFMYIFHREAQMRISTEQRMLSDAFDNRGTQQFEDHRVPQQQQLQLQHQQQQLQQQIQHHHKQQQQQQQQQHQHYQLLQQQQQQLQQQLQHKVPQVMARLDGRPFADPHVFNADGRAVTIPAGFKISKVKIASQVGRGIIGWQIYWAADGAKEIESPQRGNWNAAMTLAVQELLVPKEDFVVAVEYSYEGSATLALRLKLFFAGFTKWVGSSSSSSGFGKASLAAAAAASAGSSSLSALTMLLSCGDEELLPRDMQEEERDSNKRSDEVNYPALPDRFIIGFTGVLHNGRATNVGIVVRRVRQQGLFSYHWVNDELLRIESERTHEAMAQQSLAHSIDAKSIPSHLSRIYMRTIEGVDEEDDYDGEYDPNASHGDSLTMSQLPMMEQLSAGGHDNDLDNSDDSDNSDLDSSSVGRSSEASSVLPKPARQRRMGVITTTAQPIAATTAVKSGTAVIVGDSGGQALTSSEIQFFDIIRMRTTELSHALIRVEEFGERLWTDKTIRVDPVLGKLSNITVVKALSRWYFNALSKRLIELSHTEKPAMELMRKSKRLHNRADSIRLKMNAVRSTADVMESSVQPWTGKGVVHPVERAAKKAHNLQIQAMRNDANRMNNEISTLRLQAVVAEKRGINLLPRITLSQYVYNNYRIKIAAARHKESLLERMSLEEVKSGLFGTDQKEKLLSKEQMQAIHESLVNKQLEMKDTSSLDRMIGDVLVEESAEKNKSLVLRQQQQQDGPLSSGRQRFQRQTIAVSGQHFYSNPAQKRSTIIRTPLRANSVQPQLSHHLQQQVQQPNRRFRRPLTDMDDDDSDDDDTIASQLLLLNSAAFAGGAGSRPGSRTNTRISSPSNNSSTSSSSVRRTSDAANAPPVAPLRIKTIDFDSSFERQRSPSMLNVSTDLAHNSSRAAVHSSSSSRRYTNLSRAPSQAGGEQGGEFTSTTATATSTSATPTAAAAAGKVRSGAASPVATTTTTTTATSSTPRSTLRKKT